MYKQMNFDFQVDPSPVSPITAELNKAGISNVEEGIQYVREALNLTAEAHNAAVITLSTLERHDRLSGRVVRDPAKFQRQRWRRIRDIGLPFFCFQKLQGVSKSTRGFLHSEYKKRFQPKEVI